MALDQHIQTAIRHNAQDALRDQQTNRDYNSNLNGQLSQVLPVTYGRLDRPADMTRQVYDRQQRQYVQAQLEQQRLDQVVDRGSLVGVILSDKDRIEPRVNNADWPIVELFLPDEFRTPLVYAKVDTMSRPYQNHFTQRAHQFVEALFTDKALRAARKLDDVAQREQAFAPIIQAYNADPGQYATVEDYITLVLQHRGTNNVMFRLGNTADDVRKFHIKGVEPDLPQLNSALRQNNINGRQRLKPEHRVHAATQAFSLQRDHLKERAALYASLAGTMRYIREQHGFDAFDEPLSWREFASLLVEEGRQYHDTLTIAATPIENI